MNINDSLDVGKRAMMTHMNAIGVTGQNITNVNTQGYSRQKLELRTTSYGGGLNINTIRSYRARDKFIDKHIRSESEMLGNWDMRAQLYGQVEDTFLEPSEYGLNAKIAQFWNAWADVANDPQSAAPRSVVVQRGNILAESFNRLHSQLLGLRDFADDYIEDRVIQINNIGVQIARTNTEIVAVEASDNEASEIRDNRDMLLEKLSRLVNTSVIERETGSIAVMIGGRTLVDDNVVFAMITVPDTSDDGLAQISNVVWEHDSSSVQISGGELAGLMAIRDVIIPKVQEDLGDVASTLIQAVNDIHTGGYDANGDAGLEFFTRTDISNMAVNTEIMGDINKVAASASGEPGDNDTAHDLADLADEAVAPGGRTIGAFYSSFLEKLGAESHTATMMKENAEMLLGHLEERRESVSGVSLDEETADLIRSQRAFQAATQYMSVIDELMQSLIEMR